MDLPQARVRILSLSPDRFMSSAATTTTPVTTVIHSYSAPHFMRESPYKPDHRLRLRNVIEAMPARSPKPFYGLEQRIHPPNF